MVTSNRCPNVIAVIVTYQPDVGLLKRNIEAVRCQVDRLVVVDNSEDEFALLNLLKELGVAYHCNGENRGIAQALNVGLGFATAQSAEWVLTLDQDSVLTRNYVCELLEFLQSRPDREEIASLGGVYQHLSSMASSSLAKYLITSGNMVRLDAVLEVGGFRNDFFIDCVDYDISFKLRKAGYQIAINSKQSFIHNLGEPTRHRFMGLTYGCSNHSPLRRYYITRNRLIFYRENFVFDPGFVLRDAIHTVVEVVKIILSESDKLRKLRAVGCGIRDGLLCRLGKYPGSF